MTRQPELSLGVSLTLLHAYSRIQLAQPTHPSHQHGALGIRGTGLQQSDIRNLSCVKERALDDVCDGAPRSV